MAFDERIAAISYSVRGAVIAKYLGQLGLMVALLCLPPLLVSLLYAEHGFSLRFLIVMGMLLIGCAPLARLPAPSHLQVNEGLAITALAFALTPLLMTYPLMAGGLSFDDALFEAVSAVTTTGLSTLTDAGSQPRTYLFARAWMQWFGGLGIVVLSVSLLMGHEGARRQLIEPEASGADPVSTTRTHARRILAVYLALSAIALVAIWLSLGDGFAAATLMLSAVSTGGFSPYSGSLAQLAGHPAAFVVLLAGLAGAITIPAYYRAWNRGWGTLAGDAELRSLLLLVLVLGTLLWMSLMADGRMSWAEAGGHALLLGMSAQSTAGFSTLEVAQLDPVSKLLMVPAMLLGGSLGSTAGGIKLLRLLILLRVLQLWLRRAGAPPHAILEPWLGDRKLDNDEIQRALLVVMLFIGVVLLSWLAFVAYGHAPLNALFEVVSATATVGLSTGITSVELDPLLKGVLCLDMLAGRVEVFALLVLLFPGTWFGKRTQAT